MKAFFAEFKKFALRGNVMDMAVGVIIGAAFSGIITSLTDNFITPVLNVITGVEAYTLQEIAGFGSAFAGSVIDFILKAFILFCLMKAINRAMNLGKQEQEPAAPRVKLCPYCKTEIPVDATRCPNCTSQLEES